MERYRDSMSVDGKHVLMLGLGIHGGGASTVRWLLRHGAYVRITDLKTRRELASSIKTLPKHSRITFSLGGHRLADLQGIDLVVQNPGVPAHSPFLREIRKRKIPIVNEAVLFLCNAKGVVVGVTGTKGKSTVTALIGSVVRQQYGQRVFVGGNIKTTPMLDILDRLHKRSIAVIEFSSWHLEAFKHVKTSPHIAVVTNLLDDHLNRYRHRNAYYQAKSLIWKWQTKDDVVILNHDNVPSRSWHKQIPGRPLWFSQHSFGRGNGAFFDGNKLCVRRKNKVKTLATTNDLHIPGQHNMMNALPAVLVADLLGVPAKKIQQGLHAFHGLSGRLEKVAVKSGVAYYNDTTATAPAATIAALESFPKQTVLIAGGAEKNLPMEKMAEEIKKRAKTVLLLPGTATDMLARLLRERNVPYNLVRSMNEAVQVASRKATKGDIVLLSPGAASFGLFLHEFDRGDQFIAAVKNLP